jgi:hypothetical protein
MHTFSIFADFLQNICTLFAENMFPFCRLHPHNNPGAEPETPPSNSQKRQGKLNSRRDILDDSQESYSPLASLEHLRFDIFQGGERKDKSQGYKKGGSFVVRKFSKEDRVKAQARINAAHEKVDPSV